MNKLSLTDYSVSFIGGTVLTGLFCNNNLVLAICGGVIAVLIVKGLKRLDERRNNNEKFINGKNEKNS